LTSGLPVGDKTDQSNWSEFSSTTQQVVYEETSPLPSPTNAAGDALVGRIYVTTASDGWQVTGGCVN
jgi:hypothetical protein